MLLSTLDESAPLVQALRATGLIGDHVSNLEAAGQLHGADILLLNWPFILKPEFISRQHAILNVHNSLLPRYRGRHAFTWAILHGERQLGFSLHAVVPRVDAGDVFAQTAFDLGEDEDVNVAFRRGEQALQEWLPTTIGAWARGELRGEPQDEAKASYFRRRNDDDNDVPSFECAGRVRDLVRAVAPPYTPGAKCRTNDGAVLRFAGARLGGTAPAGCAPGTVLARDGAALLVACADGLLRLTLADPRPANSTRPGDLLLAGTP
jgi:methionyl-tRNA formyltransferase